MNGKTVLVIEDNLVNLKLVQVLLSKQAYRVLSATDSHEALDIIKKDPPDLILMDLQLPDIDGLQLARFLKNNSATSEIIIIALTAYAMKGDKEKAEQAGCDAYITKPFDTRSLTDTIASFLQRKSVS